jgi:uncharacterized protein YecE (DUF72 family)
MNKLFIGTAGWQLPRQSQADFPLTGPHLERYAARFNAVEINSTFYRLPRASTVERWAASVPKDMRFSIKMPKRITHVLQLHRASTELNEFATIVEAFGTKAGPVLTQLPPKLEYTDIAEDFLHQLHEMGFRQVALEPRHVTWFTPEVNALLERLHIARVAADPERAVGGDRPGGSKELVYYRWHGSPRIYWSSYSAEDITQLAQRVHSPGRGERWVIFDNTAQGAATANALSLMKNLKGVHSRG